MGWGISGGKSSSRSSSSSKDSVWEPQGEALGGMYDFMQNMMGGMDFSQMFGMGNQLTGDMADYTARAGQGQEQMLGGGSYGNTDDIRNQLLNNMGGQTNMGAMYENIVGGPGNTYIDPMVDAMRKSGNQQLATMNNATGGDAAAMGQGGGSRHAMQNAMQGAQMQDDMMGREMDMRGNAYDKDLAMKMGIAQQADTNRQFDNQNMMKMLQGADQNVQQGMGFSQNMQNLGMGQMAPQMQAMMFPMMMAQMWGQNIGDPTVLNESTSSGKSSSWNAGASGS